MGSEKDQGSNINGAQRRKDKRYDVSDRDDCNLFVNNKSYFINNFSLKGLGLLLPFQDFLEIGDSIGDVLFCKLEIFGKRIQDIEYRIIYMSPGQGENMVCGMELVNNDSDKESVFKSVIEMLD